MSRSKKGQKSSVRSGSAKAGKRKVYKQPPKAHVPFARKNRHLILMAEQDKKRGREET